MVADAGGAAPVDRATSSELEALVAAHSGLVYRLAVAIVHDHNLAEDVVQDVMFKAWHSLPDHGGDVPVRWLRVVTRNTAIDTLRHRRFVHVTAAIRDWGDAAAQPDRIVEGRQHLEALWDSLGTLDRDARTMLVLRESELMTYDDIAAILDTTASAVKAKLYRARHQLRVALADWDEQ